MNYQNFKFHANLYHFRQKLFNKRNNIQLKRNPKGKLNSDNSWMGKTFGSIGIVGCSKIFSKEETRLLRLLWICIILGCTGCFLWNVSYRLDYYINGHPRVRTVIVQNETYEMPVVSICPGIFTWNPIFWKYPKKWNVSIEDIFSFIEERNIDLTVLWNETDRFFRNSGMVFINGRSLYEGVISSQENVTTTEVSSLSGKCKTFSLDTEIPLKDDYSGLGVLIPPLKKSKKIWLQVLMYPKDASYFPQYFNPYVGLFLRYGQMQFIKIGINENINMNMSEKPCFDRFVVEKCFHNCLDEFHHKCVTKDTHKCRLPYVKNQEFPLCNHTQFRQVYLEVENCFNKFNINDCQCPRKCREVTFNIEYHNYNEGFGDGDNGIYFMFNKNLKITTEYWSYGFDALLADIGGTIGLFLGVSILSLFEFLFAIIGCFLYVFKPLRKQNNV